MGNRHALHDKVTSPARRYEVKSISTSDVRFIADSCRIEETEKANHLEEVQELKAQLDALGVELAQVKAAQEEQTYELKTYEEENTKLKNEIESVERNKDGLEQGLLEDEITELHSKLNSAVEEKDAYLAELQGERIIHTELQNELEATKEEIQKLLMELGDVNAERDHLQSKLKLSNAEKETLMKQLQDFQEENNRRQKHKSEKVDAKPDAAYLVNLSDINRPDKLADRFTELYNDEWTDCLEILSSEDGVCQILLGICVNIYITYAKAIDRDIHKTLAMATADMELEEDLKTFLKVLRRGKTADAIRTYWTKCKKISTSMIAHDPPVYMDTDTEKYGETFDVTLYQGYTKKGTNIDYIVWPTLYLQKNGTMLCKGVAQCKN